MDSETAHDAFDVSSGQEHASSRNLDIKRQRDLYDDRFQQPPYTISDHRVDRQAGKADTSDQPFLLCPIEPRFQRPPTTDLESFPRQRLIPEGASAGSKPTSKAAAEDAASPDRLRATTPAEAASTQMNYAFSDGAASSDTDASLLYSQTSDTDPDLGPFTPISPSNFQANETATTAGANAWRPKELRLVGRRRQESSPAESVSRSFFDASQPSTASSSTFVGLGIQLPKSSATALNDLVGPSSRATSPANKARPSKRPLKPLALASGVTSAGELPRSLSPALRTSPWDSRQRSYSNAGIPNTAFSSPASEHSRLDTAFQPSSARSREASVESSLSDWRSAPRSAIPVLPPTPAFSTSGDRSSPAAPSWARDREARATARAMKNQQTSSNAETEDSSGALPQISMRGRQTDSQSLAAETEPTPSPSELPRRRQSGQSRRESVRLSKSLSPAIESREKSSDLVARPFSPTVSFSSQARVSRSTSRRKAPPAPLILLPNGRTASMTGSPMGPSTGSSTSSSLKSSRGLPSPRLAHETEHSGLGHERIAPSEHAEARQNDLAVPMSSRGVPGSALLSPAMSVYHEAFHSPLDGPADQQDESALSGPATTHPVVAASTISSAPMIPSLSIEAVSSPPKTAYFDLDDDTGRTASTPSDYGDGASFLPSSAGSDMDSSQPSADFSKSELDAEGVPLIFRRMLKEGTPSVQGTHETSESDAPPSIDTEETQSTVAPVPSPSSVGTSADEEQGSSSPAKATSVAEASESSQSLHAHTGDLTQLPSFLESSVSFDRLGLDGHSLLEDSKELNFGLEVGGKPGLVGLEAPKDAHNDSDDARTPLAEPVDLERESLAPTPVPTAQQISEEYSLTDADADGSTDRDSDLESLNFDNVSSVSHPFAFASPPLRLGPLGELADSVEGEDAVGEEQRRRSDLSIHSHRTSEPRSAPTQPSGMVSSTPRVSESGLSTVLEESPAPAEATGNEDVSVRPASIAAKPAQVAQPPDSSTEESGSTDRASSPEPARVETIERRESEIVRCESPESLRRLSRQQSLAGALDASSQEPKEAGPSSDRPKVEATGTEDRPVFDTHIFDQGHLATAGRVASPEQSVGPTERPISMRAKSHRPMNPPPLPPNFPLKPASRLVMKALPDRSLTSPLPSNEPRNPNVDASSQSQADVKQLASRPKLRLDTSSPPPPQPAPAAAQQDERSRGAKSQLSSPVTGTSPGRTSPQQHFLNPAASHMPRSAPLPQGFFPARAAPTPASQNSSPALGYADEMDKRPAPRSAWSSESESEDENPRRNSRAKRATAKRRTSSMAPSNRASLTSASGSTTPVLSSSSQLPRKSLLHSLGLRKKSFASLSTASGSRSATPALESPGLARTATAGDGFPFPDVSSMKAQPSASQAPGPRSSRTSFASLAIGHKRQSPSIASQMSVGAASVPALRQKASSASLRTDTSGRPSLSISDNHSSESARMLMSPPPSPSREKATGARRRSKTVSALRTSMGMDAVPPMPAGARSHASSGRPSLEMPADAVEHRDRAYSTSNVPSADLKVPKSGAKGQRRAAQSALKASSTISKANSDTASAVAESAPASIGAKAPNQLSQQQGSQPAQRSSIIGSERASGAKSPKAREHSPESVENTPRIAYRALEQSEPTQAERVVPPRPRPSRKLTSQSEVEAYEHIGKGFVDAMSSPETEAVEIFTNAVPPSLGTVSSSTIPAKAGQGVAAVSDGEDAPQQPRARPRISRRAAKARKLRRMARKRRGGPKYPSLSEEGHAWVREHPGQPLSGDHGPRLLAMSSGRGYSTRGTQRSSERRGGDGRSGRERGSHDDDEDSGDDYGSYERGSGGAAGAGGGGGGGGGGSDDSDSDDDDTDDYGSARDGEEDASTSEESEDDYGEDDTVPASGTAVGDTDSEDSDDVPLGDRVDDVDVLQRRLRAQERRQQIQQTQNALENGPTRQGTSKSSRSRSARAEPGRGSRRQQQDPVASSAAAPGAQHADELSRRLMRLQMRQEQRSREPSLSRHATQAARHSPEVDISRAAFQREALPDDVRAERLTRARSLANRVRPRAPTDAPGMPPQAMNQARLRRGSDAGQRVSPSLNTPPVHTMPPLANQARGAAIPGLPNSGLPASSNAAVSQAAMAVATQAAREGRIPASAIPLQAQALAIQATSSGVTPGVMAPVNLHSSRSQRHPAYPGGGAGQSQQMPQTTPYAGQDKVRSPPADKIASPDQATRELPDVGASRSVSRRRPAAIDTRLGLSPMQGSDSPTSSNPLQSPPPWGTVASSDSHGSSGQHAHNRPRQSNGTEDEHSLSRHATRRSASGRTERNADAQQASMMPVKIQQHRVYLVNRQRYASCEVPIHARARDLVLDALDREVLQLTPGRGGWVIFEVCPRYGIERPLREYELVSTVAEARPDPAQDHFLLKQTELAPYLSLRAVPNVSPMLAGYAYVRDRRGKWSKRWLELRDHGLYHAKSDKGKEETFVCHLSSFDVYLADSSAIKAPKAHSFAVRSQDQITMFENKEDFLHYFSLSDPSAHRDWIRAILNARTYVLRQEHAALFQPPAPPPQQQQRPPANMAPDESALRREREQQPPLVATASLSRRGTSKRGVDPAQGASGAAQPPVPGLPGGKEPLIPRDAFAGPFEKGSLLANEAMRAVRPGRSMSTSNGSAPPVPPINHGSRPLDLSMHERTRARYEEERRRAEIMERQRRAREEGKTLISVADSWNDPGRSGGGEGSGYPRR